MSESWTSSEDERAQLRVVIGTIDRDLACLAKEASPEEHRSSMSSLVASWTEMLRLLALGPPPETRVCPTCRRVGMRAATRCGYCWVSLDPLPTTGAAAGTLG